MDLHCDIFVSGGGVAGLSAAITFGAAGFEVICADPAPPVTEAAAEGSDLRTTAILQPGRDLMAQSGLWDRLAGHAMPLEIMRIVDASGDDEAPRIVRDFRSADVSERPFGWNLPNWLLRREMLAQIEAMPRVSFLGGVGAKSLFTRETEARVSLSDGSRVRARLVVAADGRNSTIRQEAGIGVSTIRHGQKALAFSVTHERPHENVSTEIHRSGGPFTLVPLPDFQGQPCSAVVWMESGPEVRRLAELDGSDFDTAITERSGGLYGPLHLVTRRTVWPIISQIADRLNGQRVALLAEAAHVVPPIGAQGLNMSLTDLGCLRDLAMERPDGLGDAQMLAAFHKARIGDMRMRVAGISMLNRTSKAGDRPIPGARAAGIGALYAVPQMRQMLMRMGLGVT